MNIASCLRERREEQGLTIDEVVRRLNISARYLNGLEEGRYEVFPKSSYCHQILRTYARFLGFSDAEIANMVRECEIKPKINFLLFPKGDTLTYVIIFFLAVITFLILINL
ncbi:helix-turn-helix domain-containing protein [bacterium]|nr:helix-turn-helix domain-containing protein [bacterium]